MKKVKREMQKVKTLNNSKVDREVIKSAVRHKMWVESNDCAALVPSRMGRYFHPSVFFYPDQIPDGILECENMLKALKINDKKEEKE